MAENDGIPGLRKAAILTLALQQDTAARLLRRMSREMVEDMKGGSESRRLGRVANRLTLVNVILTMVVATSTLVNVIIHWG